MDEPITRIEQYLNGIVEGTDVPDPAITRLEIFLAAIKDDTPCALEPITRVETYLAKISGQDVAIPEPITRIEEFLAAIAGEDVTAPDAITRIEQYLAAWAEGGGPGGESISGIPPLQLLNALAKPIKRLLQHGKVTVSGTDVVCNNGTLKFGMLGNNLLDVNSDGCLRGKTILTDGSIIDAERISVSDYIEVEELVDMTYTSSADTGTGGYNRRIVCFDASKNFLATCVETSGNPIPKTTITGTTAAGTKYVRVPFATGGTESQLNLGSEALPYEPYKGEGIYADGTPEEIVVSAAGAEDQTATAENLFAVGDIEDTQDIISGKVIRRTEAVVSDGTTPSGRYVGTVGEGNIIVKVREDGYTGEIVSFETEEEKPLNGLIVEMEPQQDLHGYDAPWPGGGGANKLDPTQVSVIGSAYGLDATWDSNSGSVTLTGTWTGSSSGGAWRLLFVPTGLHTQTQYDVKGFSSSDNFSKLRWQTDADQIVVEAKGMVNGQSYTFTVYPIVYSGAEPTAWSPFANICPISGYTGVTAWNAGKNLFGGALKNGDVYINDLLKVGETYSVTATRADKTISTYCYVNRYPKGKTTGGVTYYVLAGSSENVVTFAVQDGYDYTIWCNHSYTNVKDFQLVHAPTTSAEDYEPYMGKKISVTFGALGKNLCNVSNFTRGGYNIGSIPNMLKPNTKYTYSIKGNTSYSYRLFTANSSDPTHAEVALSGTYITSGGQSTFTTPANVNDYDMLCLAGNSSAAGAEEMSAILPQIELGETATTYEPYRGEVYGGNYDFVNGKGKDGMGETDLGSKTYTRSPSGLFQAQISGTDSTLMYGNPGDALVDIYTFMASGPITGTNPDYYFHFAINSAGVIYISDPRFDNETDFKAAMDGVKLVYKLATPSDFQRDPQPVSTLEGDNNIWSNAGAVSAYVPTGDLIEQVEKQKLSTAEGDNTITITAEVEDITFDVEYKKGADAG